LDRSDMADTTVYLLYRIRWNNTETSHKAHNTI
jgi:hypothetical protein